MNVGAPDRAIIIQFILDMGLCTSYLEIGLASGATYGRIKCPRKVGVDPNIAPKLALTPNPGQLIRTTSDAFFATNREVFDVIFVDGDHTADQARRDFQNALRFLKPRGILAAHDVMVDWESTCEVWKPWLELEASGLHTCVVDDRMGCGVGLASVEGLAWVRHGLEGRLSWDKLPYLVRKIDNVKIAVPVQRG